MKPERLTRRQWNICNRPSVRNIQRRLKRRAPFRINKVTRPPLVASGFKLAFLRNLRHGSANSPAMSENEIPNSLDSEGGQSPEFRQTRWSLVRRAASFDSPESREALEALCRAYWFPIYAFIRRQGRSPHDAQDLTQDFFARLLAGHSIARADPQLGRFRTFLLGALKHFLTDAQRQANALKRGGGLEII